MTTPKLWRLIAVAAVVVGLGTPASAAAQTQWSGKTYHCGSWDGRVGAQHWAARPDGVAQVYNLTSGQAPCWLVRGVYALSVADVVPTGRQNSVNGLGWFCFGRSITARDYVAVCDSGLVEFRFFGRR